MAAIDELKNRLGTLELNIGRIQQRVQGFEIAAREARAAAAGKNFSGPDGKILPDQIEAFKAARARATAAERDLEIAQADLSSAELEISNLKTQIAQAEAADANTPTASAGQTVDNAQRSNDDRADPVAPYPTDTQTNSAPTTANQFQSGEDEDSGTNGELRRIESTQSTPPPTAQPVAPTSTAAQPNQFLSGAQEDAGTTATTQNGVGAGNDDSGAGQNPVVAALQKLYGGESETVEPTPNILDKCSSYTYNISLYLITPQQYENLITTKKKNVSGLSLILQSGGAPNSVPPDAQEIEQAADGNSALPGGRNPYFPYDYYIDDLQVKNVINGKGTMSAHSATEMSFRVLEPNGISFIQNLTKATAQLASVTGDNLNAYLAQTYLMVIRFYGYDEMGMPVTPQQEVAALQSDKTAISEKFIPFIFTNITFRISNKVTEYNCQAVTPQNMIGTGQQRGVIPFNFQLTSTTLKDLLTKDLANALNGYQAQQVKEGIFIHPDKYEFKLIPPLDLDTLKVTPPGDTNLASTAMNARPTDDPKSLNGKTQSVKADTRTNSAIAGTSIVQFLDQMVRTSDYIYQQQIFIRNPKTQKLERQFGGGKLMAWYRISVQAVPQLDKWDPKRGDYAYNITYQVAPYLVTDTLSEYFPRSPRWTAPKEYKYWFTGENTAILDYQQEFNALYYITVNTEQEIRSKSVLKNIAKKGYQPASGQSSQGMRGKVNEGSANAADYLYSPADLAEVRFTIIGDPDWMQQGDVWSGISGEKFDPEIRMPDGTINYESREALFDIVFMTPTDYNLQTGLIGPGPVGQGQPTMDEFRSRYKAVWVTNNFSRGRFTQEIQGVIVLPNVNDDDPTPVQEEEKSVAGTSNAFLNGPDQSDAETKRLASIRPVNSGITTANANAAKFAQRQESAATTVQAARAAQYPSLKNLFSSPPTSGNQPIGVPTNPQNEVPTPANLQKGRGDD